MATVTLSPKYHVVIPPEIRHSMSIRPGSKFQIFEYQDRIELVPIRDIAEMKGCLKGMPDELEREEDRF